MIYTLIAGVLILVGFAGAILPFLPGPPLALAGLIIYGFATDFTAVSVTAIIVFSILTAVSFVLDVFAPALAARGYKASSYGMIGSVLGGVFGMAVLGPLGLVLGPLAGGFVGEYLAAPDAQKALRTAWGAFVGFFVGTAVKFLVTLAMAIYFIFSLF